MPPAPDTFGTRIGIPAARSHGDPVFQSHRNGNEVFQPIWIVQRVQADGQDRRKDLVGGRSKEAKKAQGSDVLISMWSSIIATRNDRERTASNASSTSSQNHAGGRPKTRG